MLKRRPQTAVELDIPYCTRVYGTAPCMAALGVTGDRKCFQTLYTCQDEENYDEGIKTLIFVRNEDGIPDRPGVFPCLKSVSSRPGQLNLSGIDPRSSALGSRARVTFTLQDFTDNDTWLDKYQSERISGAAQLSGIGYNPETRGQFLARLMARIPYHLGLSSRVRRGYVGDPLESMPTEHYVTTEMTGPTASGSFDVTLKDIFDLAEDEKAVYPAASLGKLSVGLTEIETSATLVPEGIGETYEESGLVRIGRELMAFTRSGDVLTLTRGQEGTQATAHNSLDIVQECGVLDGLTINQAAEAVLKYKTTQFDAFIPSAEWQEENDTWYSGFKIGRVIISKPTGKKTLVGELCQLGVMIWWDPVDQEVKFKVNAPLLPGEEFYQVNSQNSLIKGSLSVSKAKDQRISAMWIFHGIRDWTDDTLSARNFNKLTIGAGRDNRYGQEAFKEVYTRWFGRSGDDATVSIIAERLYERYKDIPDVVTAMLDVKDRPAISLGSRIQVESYMLQDVDGATLAVPMQVRYVEYADDRLTFTAETYRLEGVYGFWLDDGTAPVDYDSATEEQRATGAFWADAENPQPTDTTWF